jgi:hypothetical protein
MNRRAVMITIGALALAAIAWAATRFEQVPHRQFVGMSGEARHNPFLAAQRLASRMGMSARELRALPELERLPPGGVLVLPAGRQAIGAEQRQRLLGWVERGGHLMVEAEYLGVNDPLLEAIGVRRVRTDDKPAGKSRRVKLPQSPAPLEVSGLGASIRLTAPAAGVLAQVETMWGVQLLQLERGRGRVTVSANLLFAKNHMIGDADHAEFFWQLARSLPGTRELTVFNQAQRLSLWRWLTENALAVLLAGAALLALWLWRIGPRFGPVAADPPPGRRRLLDHLRASGRYYWRNQGRARMVEAAREACLARLARAQPGFASLAPGERVAQLAAFAGITPGEAQRLVTPGEVRRGAEFIALVRAMQQVHSRLDARA